MFDSGQETEAKPMSLNRKLWLGFSAAALVLIVYVGWIFYSRWHENSEINREVKTENAQKDKAAGCRHGGDRWEEKNSKLSAFTRSQAKFVAARM